MMPEKVLVVSYYFPPMAGPATQHGMWFYKYLPEHGFETEVLTSAVYFGEHVDPIIPNDGAHRVPYSSWCQGLSYRLLQAEVIVQLRAAGLWEHGFPWSPFALREASRLIRKGGFRAIVSVSPSISSHWVAHQIKKRFPHLFWVADFTDPFVDNPFYHLKPRGKIWAERLERQIFSTADCLSANTEQVRDLWQERYPAARNKIIVTWNGYDPGEEVVARPLAAGACPVLTHAGGVYGARTPNALFESMYRLWKGGQVAPGKIVVHFLGGNDFTYVRNQQQLEELVNAGFITIQNGMVSKAEAMRVAEESDYLLVLDAQNTKLQLPSKVFDYVRIGRSDPAFTPQGSPSEYVLSRAGISSIIVDPSAPPEKVDAGVLGLLRTPPTAEKPSQWFLETYNARAIVGSLADSIRSLSDHVEQPRGVYA